MVTLYRFYDADGRLLYVGQTSNWGSRLGQHASDKPWWEEVARATFAHFDDPDNAARAEAEAILEENPVHNRLRRAPKPAPVVVDEPDNEDEGEFYYCENVRCRNCKFRQDLFLRGVAISDHACDRCGLVSLEREDPAA